MPRIPIVPSRPLLPDYPRTSQDLLQWAQKFSVASSDAHGVSAARHEDLSQEGTLAQRPTSKGLRRFFRITDTPAFNYDQAGAWKMVAGRVEAQAVCTSSTVISTASYVDITGATLTFTPSADITALVCCHFHVIVTTTGEAIECTLNVDAADLSPVATCKLSTANDFTMISQSYVVSLTGGSSHTLKLRGKLRTAVGSWTVGLTQTTLSVIHGTAA